MSCSTVTETCQNVTTRSLVRSDSKSPRARVQGWQIAFQKRRRVLCYPKSPTARRAQYLRESTGTVSLSCSAPPLLKEGMLRGVAWAWAATFAESSLLIVEDASATSLSLALSPDISTPTREERAWRRHTRDHGLISPGSPREGRAFNNATPLMNKHVTHHHHSHHHSVLCALSARRVIHDSRLLIGCNE